MSTPELKPYAEWARDHFERIQPERFAFFDYGQCVEMLKDGVVHGFASQRAATSLREWQRPAKPNDLVRTTP